MTTIEARVSTHAKRANRRPPKPPIPKAVGNPSSAYAAPHQSRSRDELHTARVTKHDRVLELLSQRNGATIPELMEATGWQQHSVRGFLAGTVKKKLGFTLMSSKSSTASCVATGSTPSAVADMKRASIDIATELVTARSLDQLRASRRVAAAASHAAAEEPLPRTPAARHHLQDPGEGVRRPLQVGSAKADRRRA